MPDQPREPDVAPRLVDRLCDDMWEGLFDMPHSLNPRPWAIQVVAGVLSALDRAGYDVRIRGTSQETASKGGSSHAR